MDSIHVVVVVVWEKRDKTTTAARADLVIGKLLLAYSTFVATTVGLNMLQYCKVGTTRCHHLRQLR